MAATQLDDGDLIRAADVAVWLDVTTQTLSRWNRARKGPPRVKLGRTIFYRASAVRQWLMMMEQVAATGAVDPFQVSPASTSGGQGMTR